MITELGGHRISGFPTTATKGSLLTWPRKLGTIGTIDCA